MAGTLRTAGGAAAAHASAPDLSRRLVLAALFAILLRRGLRLQSGGGGAARQAWAAQCPPCPAFSLMHASAGPACGSQLGVAVGGGQHAVDAHHPVLTGEHLLKVAQPGWVVAGAGGGVMTRNVLNDSTRAVRDLRVGGRGQAPSPCPTLPLPAPAAPRRHSLEVGLADHSVAHAVKAARRAKQGASVGKAVVGQPGGGGWGGEGRQVSRGRQAAGPRSRACGRCIPPSAGALHSTLCWCPPSPPTVSTTPPRAHFHIVDSSSPLPALSSTR